MVYLCESSLEGIFCGVYAVYADRQPLSDCRLSLREDYEPELFCSYKEIPLDPSKAEKAAKKIRNHMSMDAYRALSRAALHKSPERADQILRFIALGLSAGRRIMQMLKEPAVYEIFRMDQYVKNEAHFLVEFSRFWKQPSGLYCGTIGPENDVLELVASHFADRFPDMDWALCDERRKKAALHTSSGALAICTGITEEESRLFDKNIAADCYIKLWKTFFQTIAIEERKNPRCQRNMLPLRYRKYMTEFQP